jgi:hypothetical protein
MLIWNYLYLLSIAQAVSNLGKPSRIQEDVSYLIINTLKSKLLLSIVTVWAKLIFPQMSNILLSKAAIR